MERELRGEDISCYGEDLCLKSEHERMEKKSHETGSSGSRQRSTEGNANGNIRIHQVMKMKVKSLNLC